MNQTTEVIPNWKWRIERAIKYGRFTEEDFLLVESIGTCAIGERLGINKLVYGVEHMNIESKLNLFEIDMGYKFMEKVHNQKPKEAKTVYNIIQKYFDNKQNPNEVKHE